MESTERGLQIQPNWLVFFLFLLFISRKDLKKLGFKEMNLLDLEKKSKFLNRIKGYMDPQEQHIIHSAETVIDIVKSMKLLSEPTHMGAAGVTYSSLSLEERKRNMLMDLSEFLQDETKMLIHQAVGFDEKVKTLEKKLKELHVLSQNTDNKLQINDYIDVFEPLLADEIKEKIFEFKKLISILKVISTMKNKDKIDELDIIEMIQPFVHKEQSESLMNMLQIFKAVSSMSNSEE